MPAAKFGPLALKALRQQQVDEGQWCRTTINKQAGIIKRMFRWGVENELVPPTVYQGLQAVSGLKRGRCGARETDPVKPVCAGPHAAVVQNVEHSPFSSGITRLFARNG